MRLESAIRTAIAVAGDEVIQKSSEWSGITGRFDLRGGSGGTQGNMTLYSREAFKSGKRVAGLWKKLDEARLGLGSFRRFDRGMLRGAGLRRGFELRFGARV